MDKHYFLVMVTVSNSDDNNCLVLNSNPLNTGESDDIRFFSVDFPYCVPSDLIDIYLIVIF